MMKIFKKPILLLLAKSMISKGDPTGEGFKLANESVSLYKELNLKSYDLRLGDDEFLIEGNIIYEKKKYIVLHTRKPSQLSTMEKLKLPKDICATVGITFSVSLKGLIPLFGPQVDPGYEGKFYGVVYNLTSIPINLVVGEKIFKMYFMKVQGETSIINNKPLKIPKLDKMPITILGHTKIDSLGELEKSIKDHITDLADFCGRLNSVEGGYK
jgi:deoxycytidine triphosphate deaminase